MKKTIFTICFLLSSVMVMAQAMSYKIKGQLPKSIKGEVVLVINNQENGTTTDIGSSKIKDGAFEFNGEVADITVAYIMPKEKNAVWATLFLENGEYNVSADATGMNVMGGGDYQEIYGKFEAVNKFLSNVKQQCDLKAKSMKDQKQLVALQVMFNKAVADAAQKEVELIKKYNDSYVSAYVIASTMLAKDEKSLKERYDLLDEKNKSSLYGKQILNHLGKLKNLAIGATAPDFSAPLADGGTVKLDEVKAKVKVIYFCASWSVPCRDENVSMLKLYRQYRPQGLEIIGVSLDVNKGVWLRAIGEDGSTWKNIMDIKDGKSVISSLYCVSSIPCTYILDENNKIVAKNLLGDDLKNKVDQMLRKK